MPWHRPEENRRLRISGKFVAVAIGNIILFELEEKSI